MPKIDRKTINIRVNQNIIDDFKYSAFEFFKNHNAKNEFNYGNYFKILIYNLDKSFLLQYGEILHCNDINLKYYKSVGKKKEISTLYNHNPESASISFYIEIPLEKKLYDLIHTYYVNEKSQLHFYSVTYFFYDIMKIINFNSLEYIDKNNMQNYIQSLIC